MKRSRSNLHKLYGIEMEKVAIQFRVSFGLCGSWAVITDRLLCYPATNEQNNKSNR